MENQVERYIVFLPIKEGTKDQVDIESGLFGIFTDDEYDTIRPYDKVRNYSTSYSFTTEEKARGYENLVKKVNGDMTKWGEVGDFEDKNAVSILTK